MLSWSNPSQCFSCACAASLLPLSLYTIILYPHSYKFCKLGLLPLNTLDGVFSPNAYVDVWLKNQTTCFKALPHRNSGKLTACSMAHTFSNSVRFSRSTIPLCSEVSWIVKWCWISFSTRYLSNSLLLYSPLLSECMSLILIAWLSVTDITPQVGIKPTT